MGLLDDIGGWAKDVGHALAMIGDPTVAVHDAKTGGQAAPAPAKSKKKAAAKPKAQTQQAPAPPSPWQQLAQALAGQMAQEEAPIEAAISGQLTAPAEQSAIGTALTAAGIPAGSQTANWMNQQVATANKIDDPLQQALAAYGSAYGAGAQAVGGALANLGGMEQLGIQAAPAQPWLNALSQPSRYYGVPAGVASTLPPALQYYLSQGGWTGVSPPAGGWGPNAPKTAASANPFGNITGTPPTAAGAPPSAGVSPTA